MKVVILALLSLLIAAPVKAQSLQALSSAPARADRIQLAAYSALAAASVLDLHSTFRAIGNGTGREGNPFLMTGHPTVAIAEKAAALAATVWMSEQLRAHGHPRAAKVVVWCLAGGTAAVAAHNYTLSQ